MPPFRKILHPTDFSESSEAAFRVACSLARDYGARLMVVHVRQVPVALTRNPDAFPPEPPEVETALRSRLYAVKPDDPHLAVWHYLLEGDAAAEVLDFAAEQGCDLIVMGTHGWTGLGRLLMGSVAEQVLRRALCPVLTISTPLPEAVVETAEGLGQRLTPATRPAAISGR
jgi:nucleotide-binding universal stress UspA family protein